VLECHIIGIGVVAGSLSVVMKVAIVATCPGNQFLSQFFLYRKKVHELLP
jgi:hypothetical protein